jgi:hypothetical protein
MLLGRRPQPAEGHEYVGQVADDVDHLRGELVKLRATIDRHVPSARQNLMLFAAAVATPALSRAAPAALGSGR